MFKFNILKLCLAIAGILGVGSWANASSFHTATKSGCFIAPCEITGTGSFSVATNQTVKWTATWTDVAPHGNDFYLSTSGPNMADILIDGNLSGFHSGEFFLNAGNYFIAINTAVMGEGSYTIEFNRQADCSLSPSSHDFGDRLAGSAAVSFDFDITLAGDLLDVEIGSITSSDGHFTISGGTGTTLHNPSPFGTTFTVTFTPGSTAGDFAATITIDTPTIDGQNPPNKTVSVTGTTVPLEPDIACVSQGSTPTVDWFGAGPTVSLNFTKSFENEGNQTLNITSITLIDNAGGRFTLNGAASTAPLAAGGTRGVNLTLTVPRVAASEGTYSGTLRIVSDSPGEETLDCNFSARAHHPEPEMVVEILPDAGMTANYREVELGFTFTKAIKIRNTGDAPLTLTVDRLDPADADWPQWSEVNEPNNVTVAAGGETILLQRFKPLANGTYTVQMTCHGTGGGGTYDETETVTLTGSGISPVPIHTALVLDRSGSMADIVGPRSKIDGLQKAARLYYDLLRPNPGDNTGDHIAMVKYSSSAADYFVPMQQKSAAIDATVFDLLSEAATSDNARLQPDGGTCISCGLLRGADQLLASPDTVKEVLIVMTDGLETAGANITDQMLSDVQTANPEIMMYSLGLGNDIDEQLLQKITNQGDGGFHQVSESLLGTDHFALEEFYFKIYATATGADLIVDPTESINIASGNPVEVNHADVISSDRYAIFMVLDDPALAQYYTLQFIDPHGSLLDPTSSIGGIPIQMHQRDGHTVYKIIFPDASQSHIYVGRWKLVLVPNGKWKPEKHPRENKAFDNYLVDGEWIFPHQGDIPIGFGAAVKSDLNMIVNVTANHTQPGADVLLTATLVDRGWPTGGSIDVAATKPNQATTSMILYDDGSHGDTQANDGVYTNHYNQTALQGSYKFFFNGKVLNDRGEIGQRQATRYVSLFAPDPPGGGGGDRPGGGDNCFPCWLYWVMLLLLLIILWLIIRCCKRMMSKG
ncbi:MAG: choice-of-anchor D domain-containing protein [Flavobacteriales bacterium]